MAIVAKGLGDQALMLVTQPSGLGEPDGLGSAARHDLEIALNGGPVGYNGVGLTLIWHSVLRGSRWAPPRPGPRPSAGACTVAWVTFALRPPPCRLGHGRARRGRRPSR